MWTEFVDLRTLVVISHIIGTVMGVGGVYIAAVMFFKTMRRGLIEQAELDMMNTVSQVVAIGIVILFFSGVALFMFDPDKYMGSSKFLVKMFIVVVILLNGIVLHRLQVPFLQRFVGLDLRATAEFQAKKALLLITGTTSVVSWTIAMVLGMLRGIPYSLTTGLLVYLGLLGASILGAVVLRHYLIPTSIRDRE